MRKTPVLVAAAALLSGGLVALASPAQAISDPVDIRVEHDLVDTDGPRVLEVIDVTVGDGPEITVADETENPSSWGGNVLVDIDDTAKTITVEVEDDNCYDTVLVRITTPEITSVTTVSDEIFDPTDTPVTLTTSVEGGVVTLSWVSDESDCPSFNGEGAQSVFSYGDEAVPTATLAPDHVQDGDPVTVSGDGCPNSPVEVIVTPDGSTDPVVEDEVTGDAEGSWSYEVDTTGLDAGIYDVATRCILADGQGFDYDVLSFTVSFTPAPAEPAPAAPTFTG